MSDKQESYSAEFKAEVAQKALVREKKNLEPLADEYDVPVSVILTWAVQLERNAAAVFEVSKEPTDVEYEPEPPVVDIELADKDLETSIEQGVMSDDLNYKRLLSWTIIGLILVVTFVQMLLEMFQVNISKTPEQVIGEDAFYKVTHKKRDAKTELSSFGVINEEEGVYHVPIDMVIEQMAEEAVPDTTRRELLKKIDPTPVEK